MADPMQTRWIQRFKCGLCTEDREFTQQSHCERHMTAVHSGFVFRCATCGIVLGRKDQKHGCEGRTLQRVKKSTLTLTIEEEKEFEAFQRGRGRHVVPFMKELPLVFSDQPYHQGQEKKRAIYTEPHQGRNAKKRPKRSAQAPALLSSHRSAPAPALLSMSTEKSITAPAPLSTKMPTPGPALLSTEKSDPEPALPSTEKSIPVPPLLQSEKSTSSRQSKNDTPQRRSFKRLFGDSLSDSSDEEDLLTPDISITEPPVTSTPSRTLTTMTEREFDKRDVSIQTSPSGSAHPLVSQQCIGLDVGGKLFVTTVATLTNQPDSLFARMMEDPTLLPAYNILDRGNLPVYFIDRDATYFDVILHYMRDGPKNINCHLPNDVRTLRKIHIEAVYYRLETLVEIIGSQLFVMIFGHKEFSEE
ncbi:uncharacterized protein LOC134268575 [Saccostrea cucullata]|uniref:uncharacterized protein LOC134268575 n=1 Tax=Saccostrea cuccullata TaxID=36930 RepID=UPI002ED213F7